MRFTHFLYYSTDRPFNQQNEDLMHRNIPDTGCPFYGLQNLMVVFFPKSHCCGLSPKFDSCDQNDPQLRHCSRVDTAEFCKVLSGQRVIFPEGSSEAPSGSPGTPMNVWYTSPDLWFKK